MSHVRRSLAGLCLLATVPGVSVGAVAGEPASVEPPPTVFGVYAENRARGLPNYITADLPLIAYSLLGERSVIELEDTRIRPLFATIVELLDEAIKADSVTDAGISARNRDFVALLEALLNGDPAALDGEVADEYALVIAAAGIARSPLWSRPTDYTQYVPRGRYAGDGELEGFFRAMRYAGSQRFAAVASRATVTDLDAARQQTRQGVQLARLIATDTALGRAYRELESALDWQFGPTRELDVLHWVEIADAASLPREDDAHTPMSDERVDAIRDALLERSRAEQRRPRVFDAIVDPTLLEPGLETADALVGLRLFGARETGEGAAQQRLLYPETGLYHGEADAPLDAPFGLGVVGGRPVKAYPVAAELLALLGAEDVRSALEGRGEAAFEDYEAAFADARTRLEGAGAAETLHLDLLRAGLGALDERDAGERAESLLAFHARHRHLGVLYTRQPYTAVGKSLTLVSSRDGADLEVATGLYAALADAARTQARRTGLHAWSDYANRIETLQGISAARERGEPLTRVHEQFLNDLDRWLLVAGVTEAPIVVDVHTDPGSSTVVQQATGAAVLVERGGARGAHASFHEFKVDSDQRLTPDAWRRQLAASTEPASGGPR